ncbi:CD99 antigen-like protein 2 isoform X2 [Oryzias latipes]|uniref:CD99 antigen-like protein 2 isoform X2 n=1 Tax=Oryzias latipes TaxID=8090 RepID=UPI0005CC5DAD|nr:CD99 antigen-like protein 2 isoform X2 [Oryzias latipes]
MSQSDTGHPQRNALPAPKRSARRSRRSRRSRRAGAAMKSLLITASLLLLISGTRTQGGFDLSDALDDHPTDAPKPKEPTKSPEKPKPDNGFDLGDALLPDPKTTKKPSVPSGGGGGGGGGSFSDDDLLNTLDDGYKPDKTGSRGRAADSNYDAAGGADQPQEAGSGPIAGIISAIGVALVGAASGYFAYQKKKLCFKLQGGTDPESGKGRAGTQAEPQVLSNLLQSN